MNDKKKYLCNCKKSKCLKLYCDCFANGELCINCNCNCCMNKRGNETEIRKAYNDIKDKNPIAMKLTNLEEPATLCCNCTKSNCLKKYCECFKAGIHCSQLCRCRDCDNTTIKPLTNTVITKNDIYEGYAIQKISVFIHNNTIEIEITNTTPSEHYKQQQYMSYTSYNNDHNRCKCQQQQPPQQLNVAVRVKNHQTIIEIPKRMLNIPNEDIHSLLYLGNKRYKDNE